MSKITANCLVNRRKLSPCPHEIVTPRVTRVVKWRNNICCLWKGGSGKRRRGRQKWEQILPFLKDIQKVWAFHWFQMKQKSLTWNWGERGCFPFPFVLKFPFETGSYQYYQKHCKHRAKGQTWTRFIVKWGRKQVRTAFSLALPSFCNERFSEL